MREEARRTERKECKKKRRKVRTKETKIERMNGRIEEEKK